MKKILVTGGAGFIGKNLISLLINTGYEVRVLDKMIRCDTTHSLPESVDLHNGDIRDVTQADKACRNIDFVIHLAAYGSVVESIENPLENFDINVRGTLNMLRAAQKAGVKKFVMASTGGALIGNAPPPVNESSLPKPISPYGAGKLSCEAYCNAFSESLGLNTVILRFANIYGPYSAHKKGAVTAFIKAIMNNDPICIYGDGSATRDFLYVDDLCSGILSVLENELIPGTALHLASGIETSIKELAETLLKIAAASGKNIQFLPRRKGEIEKNFATYDLAARLIDFTPKIDLQEGLRRTWEWFRQIQ